MIVNTEMSVHGGIAYALGTTGHLHDLDVVNGDGLWKRDLNTQYNLQMARWGLASAPLVEGDLLIVQIGGSPEQVHR